MDLYSVGKSKISVLKRYLKDYAEGRLSDADIQKAYPGEKSADVVAQWRELYQEAPWMLGSCYGRGGTFQENDALDYFWHFRQIQDEDIPMVLKANHIHSLLEMKPIFVEIKEHVTNQELIGCIDQSLLALEQMESIRKFFSLATEKKLAFLKTEEYVLRVNLSQVDDFVLLLKDYLQKESLAKLNFRWEIRQD